MSAKPVSLRSLSVLWLDLLDRKLRSLSKRDLRLFALGLEVLEKHPVLVQDHQKYFLKFRQDNFQGPPPQFPTDHYPLFDVEKEALALSVSVTANLYCVFYSKYQKMLRNRIFFPQDLSRNERAIRFKKLMASYGLPKNLYEEE
jgi:hypothetical protein